MSKEHFIKLLGKHGLDGKDTAKLIKIFDEDGNGDISLQEFYNALDTYNCRGEPDVSPFGPESLMTF